MSKRRRAERFHAACERLGDKRSIARIEKRHAQSVPFASGSEHACRLTLCLLKDGLRTDGYFFRLDDSKQPASASHLLLRPAARQASAPKDTGWGRIKIYPYTQPGGARAALRLDVDLDGVSVMVQATTDEFPQAAPLDGYVTSWKIEESAGARNFHREAKVRRYVRTSGARYGVVDLHLSHPNKREIGPTVTVKSYVNPSGSRNLEYGPRKVAGTGK